MLKNSAICLAPSSQFCFVCVDFIPRYALPTRRQENLQQSEHSSYQFGDTSGKRACATLPRKVLVPFGLLFGHILNQSLWQERKKIYRWVSPGSYAQHWNQEERPAKVCQQKMRDKHEKWAQRKVFLPFLFLLTSPWSPPRMPIEVVCIFCWALYDSLLTYPD